ncbi:MAG: YfcE family phosphodiesterase [Bacilli bacterium]|nr:YfcE family phosphodiesterase [Bacilli bacterium]
MDILVVSDIHRQTDILSNLMKRHWQAQLFLDAGDSERHEIDLDPFLSVRGNCDFFIKPKYRVIPVLNHQIYLFHGNSFPLNTTSLKNLAVANQCDIIIHGHTHKPYYIYEQGVHILCPGSVTFPRTDVGATYALISIDEEKVDVKIMKVNSNE